MSNGNCVSPKGVDNLAMKVGNMKGYKGKPSVSVNGARGGKGCSYNLKAKGK